MQHFTVKDNKGNNWQRISKVKAQKAFDNGLSVVACSHKMHPFGAWGCGIEFDPRFTDHAFDELIRNCEWYNCNYETGYYSAFYVKC